MGKTGLINAGVYGSHRAAIAARDRARRSAGVARFVRANVLFVVLSPHLRGHVLGLIRALPPPRASLAQMPVPPS